MPLEFRIFVRDRLVESHSDARFPPPPPQAPPPPPSPVDPDDEEIIIDLDDALRPRPQKHAPQLWRHAIRCLRDPNWDPDTHPLPAAGQGHTEIESCDGLDLTTYTQIFRDAGGLRVRVRATSSLGVVGQIFIRRY